MVHKAALPDGAPRRQNPALVLFQSELSEKLHRQKGYRVEVVLPLGIWPKERKTPRTNRRAKKVKEDRGEKANPHSKTQAKERHACQV